MTVTAEVGVSTAVGVMVAVAVAVGVAVVVGVGVAVAVGVSVAVGLGVSVGEGVAVGVSVGVGVAVGSGWKAEQPASRVTASASSSQGRRQARVERTGNDKKISPKDSAYPDPQGVPPGGTRRDA